MGHLEDLFLLLHLTINLLLATVRQLLGIVLLLLRVTLRTLLTAGIPPLPTADTPRDQQQLVVTAQLQAAINRRLQGEHVLTANALSKETTVSALIATKECGNITSVFLFF